MKMVRYTNGLGEEVEWKYSTAIARDLMDRDIKFEVFEAPDPSAKVVLYNVVNGRYMLSTPGTPDHERRINKNWEVTDATPEDFVRNYREDD